MKQSLVEVTERIIERSRPTRSAYLHRVDQTIKREKGADRLGCANVAHAVAALPSNDNSKSWLKKHRISALSLLTTRCFLRISHM